MPVRAANAVPRMRSPTTMARWRCLESWRERVRDMAAAAHAAEEPGLESTKESVARFLATPRHVYNRSFKGPVFCRLPHVQGCRVNNDVEFLKRFSMLIGFLILVAICLITLGHFIGATQPRDPEPTAQARTLDRIKPVGAVYAGASGAAAAAAAAEKAKAAAASQVAYEGTLDGSVIYGKLCSACHGTGAGGAPTLDHSHWDARIAQGVDVLIRHSIDGFTGAAGLMPARGGNPSLSDEQAEAAVRWMIDNLK